MSSAGREVDPLHPGERFLPVLSHWHFSNSKEPPEYGGDTPDRVRPAQGGVKLPRPGWVPE